MRVHEVLLAIAVVASYPIIADRARAVDSDGRIYDIVFERVRAIDPETGLDAVRNIGIVGNKIGAISVQPLQGKKSIDARGLVASPGFIDLHSHAYGYETATYQAMDGVTTRLELELGVFPVKRWYDKKAGHELINYGASVNHDRVRYSLQVGGDLADARIPGDTSNDLPESDGKFDALIHQPIPAEAYDRFIPMLEAGLKDGAIGIGSGTSEYDLAVVKAGNRWLVDDVSCTQSPLTSSDYYPGGPQPSYCY